MVKSDGSEHLFKFHIYSTVPIMHWTNRPVHSCAVYTHSSTQFLHARTKARDAWADILWSWWYVMLCIDCLKPFRQKIDKMVIAVTHVHVHVYKTSAPKPYKKWVLLIMIMKINIYRDIYNRCHHPSSPAFESTNLTFAAKFNTPFLTIKRVRVHVWG